MLGGGEKEGRENTSLGLGSVPPPLPPTRDQSQLGLSNVVPPTTQIHLAQSEEWQEAPWFPGVGLQPSLLP